MSLILRSQVRMQVSAPGLEALIVLLSVGLALVFRRRYIAAVVRLHGHDEVERNEAQPPSVRSALLSAPALRLVKDDLTDRSPGVLIAALESARRSSPTSSSGSSGGACATVLCGRRRRRNAPAHAMRSTS
jgi:hypothetical protein